MQVKIDEQVARCLAYLRAPEFEPLVAYLRAKRQGSLEKMAQVHDAEMIYRFQGEVGILGELISQIESAEALIAKMKANRMVG